MNDSREFQDVESLRSGRISHVPSQLAVVPSPRGLLSRDPSLRHEIWNSLDISGNVIAGPCASALTSYTGVLNPWASDATGNILVLTGTGRPVAGNEVHNRDTIPTPRFARRSSARNSFIPMDGGSLQNYMVDQQRPQVSELHFDKFPTPSTFSCCKIRFKNRGMFLFKFYHGINATDQRSEGGRFSGRFKNHRAPFKETLISRISSCSTRGSGLL